MRYLLLSDVHANIDALEAVLAAAPPGTYDQVLVLGDLVGYGAEPNAVVERVRALDPAVAIRGNHDKVAAGLEGADGFNPTAQRAALWTRAALTADVQAYLRGLAEGPLIVDDLIEVFHGSPIDEDLYIFGESDAVDALISMRRPVGFFGHTHVATAFTLTPDRSLDVVFRGAVGDELLAVEAGTRYLVNPGSVGQPRDGDPRAGFAIIDTDQHQIALKRVAYDVERAAARVVAAGLPKVLSQRLVLGR